MSNSDVPIEEKHLGRLLRDKDHLKLKNKQNRRGNTRANNQVEQTIDLTDQQPDVQPNWDLASQILDWKRRIEVLEQSQKEAEEKLIGEIGALELRSGLDPTDKAALDQLLSTPSKPEREIETIVSKVQIRLEGKQMLLQLLHRHDSLENIPGRQIAEEVRELSLFWTELNENRKAKRVSE
jgi:hypothetical protein